MTERAFLVGLLIAAFVNIGSPYTESVGFSNFSWSYLPEGAMMPFLLVILVNALLYKWRPRASLRADELALIFIMALVSNCTPLFLMFFFLSAIASPLYYASPENRWGELLIPYLKPWLFVSDKLVVRWFYEGVPPGMPLIAGPWLLPLLIWFPFLLAVQVSSYALVSIFRKQWAEGEKLSYPLVQLPLELIRGRAWRGKLFWAGLSIPPLLAALDAAHHFKPVIPAIPIDHIGCINYGMVTLHPKFPPLRLCFNFLAFATGYFVPLNVLFSVWFFYLACTIVEDGLLNVFGYSLGYGGMFVWGSAAIAWQSCGAFMVFLASIFWTARRHLKEVLRKALGLRSEVDDSDEPMSYRFAFWALLGSIAFMVLWLCHSGMPWWVALAFIVGVLLFYLGLARVICQSGIFYLVPPMPAQNLVIYTAGPKAIGHQGMVALGLSYSWHGDVQTVLAGLAAEGFKVRDETRLPGRALTLAVFVTVVLGLILSPLGIILHGYLKGAVNWNTWVFRGWGPNTYGQVLTQIQNPSVVDRRCFIFFAYGALAMIVLTMLHLRFPWWPLHPLGLAVVSSFTMYAVYAGFLLAWIVKGLILRWGGFRAFRFATPFFIGLMVGHYIGRAISLVAYSVLKVPML